MMSISLSSLSSSPSPHFCLHASAPLLTSNLSLPIPTLQRSSIHNPICNLPLHPHNFAFYLGRLYSHDCQGIHGKSRKFGLKRRSHNNIWRFFFRVACSSSADCVGEGDDGTFANESGSESEEVEEGESDDFEAAMPPVDRWDVLGLGQAMVDFSGVVGNEFLERLGLEKGARKVVNHEERGKVLRAMDGCSYKAAAGGSLSNSLVALARLGCHPKGSHLNVAMAGSVGSDPLGGFYREKLRRAGVNFLSSPVKDGTTGTVIVLTTPDAQRTMLAYQGTSSTITYDPGLSSVIKKANILVVEGYLFELPDTIKSITKACKEAHDSGALVAVTASDISCIERHYDDFWEIIGNYADVVFANRDEARALCHFSCKESPLSSARYLSHFVPLVSVTDGPKGSYISTRGDAVYIPPPPCVPIDTCGAGDAYASGILYGILRGVSDLNDMGEFASKVAAVVVGQQGTRLKILDAIQLAESNELIMAAHSSSKLEI